MSEPWRPLTLNQIRDYHEPVRCACGRKENASMMYDVRGLHQDVRRATMRQKGPAEPTPDWLCGGCLVTLQRWKLTDQVAILEAQGAPVELLGQLAAKRKYTPLATGPMRLSAAVAKEAKRVDRDVAHETALLEDDVRFPSL